MKRILSLILSATVTAVFASAQAQETKKEVSKKPKAAQVEAPKKASPKKAPASTEDAPVVMPTHFKKGWQVVVQGYDDGIDAFELGVVGEGESGLYHFTAEELLKGADVGVSLKDLTPEKKKALVGSEFTLKADIRFLTYEEYVARGGDPDVF